MSKVRSVNDPDVKPEYVENLKKTAAGRLHLAALFPNDFRVDPADVTASKGTQKKTSRSPAGPRIPSRTLR